MIFIHEAKPNGKLKIRRLGRGCAFLTKMPISDTHTKTRVKLGCGKQNNCMIAGINCPASRLRTHPRIPPLPHVSMLTVYLVSEDRIEDNILKESKLIVGRHFK